MYLIFFLCGYLKSRIYFNRPNNLEDLRHRIRAEMEQISPNIIERGVQCLQSCVVSAISTFALHFIVNLDVCLFLFEVNKKFYIKN
jgi:hypothetical protein